MEGFRPLIYFGGLCPLYFTFGELGPLLGHIMGASFLVYIINNLLDNKISAIKNCNK